MMQNILGKKIKNDFNKEMDEIKDTIIDEMNLIFKYDT